MELSNEQYTVVIRTEEMPSLERYDIVYGLEHMNRKVPFYMVREIRINKVHGEEIVIAFLDNFISAHKYCAVLAENVLTMILSKSIVRIDLHNGSIMQNVACVNTGGLFEIHPIDDGYLIWGEDEISRYDSRLNRLWSFSGRDILVSQTGTKSFWIDHDLIHCMDWEGWHYVLNYEGKLIGETCDPEGV